MGHSFGAATTVTALADDKRFKYCIMLLELVMHAKYFVICNVELISSFINHIHSQFFVFCNIIGLGWPWILT